MKKVLALILVPVLLVSAGIIGVAASEEIMLIQTLTVFAIKMKKMLSRLTLLV